MVQFFFSNRTFSLSHFVEVICGNKYFRLKLTVRLFCLRSRLCNHKMWKCIWCQPDLSLITKEQTWLYIHKKHDFCLNFCRLAHTNTFKKLGSLFDLPQIPDIIVSREAIMHHGSALFWQKKTRQIMMGRVRLKRKRFTVKKVDASHYLTNAWSSCFLFCFLTCVEFGENSIHR